MRWPLWICVASVPACTFGTDGSGSGSGPATIGGTDTGDTGELPGDDGVDTTATTAPDDTDETSAVEVGEESGDGSTTEADGSSSDTGTNVDPVCGDGNPDPGEDCDDGDEIDANGCTNLCTISGAVDWSTPLPGESNFSEILRAVVYHEDLDTYFAVGYQRNGMSTDTLRLRFDGDGEITNTVLAGDAFSPEFDRGLALTDLGDLAIVGNAGALVRVEIVDPDLGVLNSQTYTGSGVSDDIGWDVAFNPQGVGIAVGGVQNTGFDAWAHRVGNDGSDGWTAIGVSNNYDFFRGITWSGATDSYFGILNDLSTVAAGSLVELNADGVELNATAIVDPSGIRTRGVAVDEAAVYVCGYTTDPSEALRAQVMAFGFDGTPQWTSDWLGAEGLGGYYIELVVDGEGNLVVVGTSKSANKTISDLDVPVVRKLDPSDGSEIWTTLVEVDNAEYGSLVGVAIGPDNRIVAVGGGAPAGEGDNPLIVSLNP